MKAGTGSRSRALRGGRFTTTAFVLFALGAVLTVSLATGATTTKRAFKDVHATKTFWHTTKLKAASHRLRPAMRFRGSVRSFTLRRSSLRRVLALAPRARLRGTLVRPLVVSLPDPNGDFQRFALHGPIMAPGLARSIPRSRPTAAAASTIARPRSTPT